MPKGDCNGMTILCMPPSVSELWSVLPAYPIFPAANILAVLHFATAYNKYLMGSFPPVDDTAKTSHNLWTDF